MKWLMWSGTLFVPRINILFICQWWNGMRTSRCSYWFLTDSISNSWNKYGIDLILVSGVGAGYSAGWQFFPNVIRWVKYNYSFQCYQLCMVLVDLLLSVSYLNIMLVNLLLLCNLSYSFREYVIVAICNCSSYGYLY